MTSAPTVHPLSPVAPDHAAQLPSKDYYESSHLPKMRAIRTYSSSETSSDMKRPILQGIATRSRRLSHDEKPLVGRKFLIPVEETMRIVLEQEDTDGDYQISITDAGPKVLAVGTATSNGYKSFDIRGQYMISNLLQELALASSYGRKNIVLDEARLSENPVDRLERMIRTTFWPTLTRRLDGDMLLQICADPKNRSNDRSPRIYVPHGEDAIAAYYVKFAEEHKEAGLVVERLPPLKDITPKYVKSLNDKPGILALAMKEVEGKDGKKTLEGISFIVPGGRFVELYNWDSYFISLGLLVNNDVEMARGILEHFIFEIKNYGRILNGNRSYYLCRSQPPFLTDFALQVFSRLDNTAPDENEAWLARAIRAAIKEYHSVWMAFPRLDPKTGLSRYRPDGLGIPPETEASHFTHLLQPFAAKHGLSVNDFIEAYNDGVVKDEELDEYFMHDRAVRESGHDTTYRFERVCADLATVDLNTLLYKYEIDIATSIREVFGDELILEDDFELSPFPFGSERPYKGADASNFPSFASLPADASSLPSSTKAVQTSAEWFARAARRKDLIDHYLWNEGQGMYFDYNTKKGKQIRYESCTTFWALWAGVASRDQAARLVREALPKFEVAGGIVACTEASRGEISLDRPNRQWDYPYAWAPHQILAWVGLQRYDYEEEAQRTAYRWLYMVLKAFVDFNGVVPEKYDAVALSTQIKAEYGNQGVDFKMVPREGFGWCNTSFSLGLMILNTHQRRALGALVQPDNFFCRMTPPMSR